MNCKECLSIIEEYVERSLDPQTCELAAAHTLSCESCRKTYEELQNENEIYSRYLLKIKEQPNSWAAVRTEIRRSGERAHDAGLSQRFSAVFFSRPLYAAVAAIMLVAVGFGLWYRVSVQEPEPPPVADSRNPPSNERNSDQPSASPKTVSDSQVTLGTSTRPVRPRQPRMAQTRRVVLEITNDHQPFDSSEAAFNRHIEKCEMVLRSFRNAVLKTDEAGLDISYERRVAKDLYNNSVNFRREAQSQGNLPVENLLVDLEGILGAITKLPRKAASSDTNVINGRIQESGIIGKLQIQSSIARALD